MQGNGIHSIVKNVQLLGAALMFLTLGDWLWGIALNVGFWALMKDSYSPDRQP